jgi:hypothetical protein
MVSSRLIERLDGAITTAAEPLQREYLKAERAGALARLGLLADARFALSGLRTQNQRHRDTLLAAWIQLVDGQIDHFDSIAPHAAGKFQRAHAGPGLGLAGDLRLQRLRLACLDKARRQRVAPGRTRPARCSGTRWPGAGRHLSLRR